MSINYLWGNHAWTYLHYVSFNYPINPSSDDKLNYKNFYYNIKYTLPCDECKNHFTEMIKYFPIDNFLENRWTLIWWLFIVHTVVNIRLNKNIIYDFNDLLVLYNNFKCDKCSVKNDNNIEHMTNEQIKKYLLEKYYDITCNMYNKYIEYLNNSK